MGDPNILQCKTEQTHKMKSLLMLSTMLALTHAECNSTLPDGGVCGGDTEGDHADPAECSMFYHCSSAGCVTHEHCPQDKPLYHTSYNWCMQYEDVECGDRPCNDQDHCTHTTLAPTQPPDCGHYLDCEVEGDGFWPDPYNCRKYWHCFRGEGEHVTCQDDFLFNTKYDGCDYPEEVECGDRPVCGDCDEDCEYQSTPAPDCGHLLDCSSLPGGWYPDPYNCRKYWHCEADYDTEATHFLCDDNLLYDPDQVSCDFPANVRCGDRPVCGDCDQADCAGCDQACQG